MTKLSEENINKILKSEDFLILYEKYKKNINVDKLSNFFDDIETNKNYFRLNIKKSKRFFEMGMSFWAARDGQRTIIYSPQVFLLYPPSIWRIRYKKWIFLSERKRHKNHSKKIYRRGEDC